MKVEYLSSVSWEWAGIKPMKARTSVGRCTPVRSFRVRTSLRWQVLSELDKTALEAGGFATGVRQSLRRVHTIGSPTLRFADHADPFVSCLKKPVS